MRGSFAATSLASIAHIEMGQSPDSSTVKEGDDCGVPFLQGNAEFGGTHPVPRLSCTAPMKMCKAGDILISVRAPVGAMNIADRDYCIGRGLAAVRIAGMSPTLAAHIVNAAAPALRRVAQGTTFEAISKSDLASLVVMLPPQADIEPLGRLLTTLDTTIHQTEAIIEKLKQVKQGLLYDLLTRGIDANGELRPPQSEALHLYKYSPLGWIPKEWGCDALNNVVRIIDCKHITPTYVDQGYPVVRPRNVKAEGLDLFNVEFVSAKDFAAMTDLHAPRRGDIVLSRNASFGVPAFVDTDRQFAIGQDVIVLTQTISNTRFLFYCLQSSLLEKQIERRSAGSTFGRINLSDIRELSVPSPDLAEQTAIATRLASVDIQTQSELQSCAKLRTLKSGLMDDLLTGRVRVTPLLT